jgi:hypothetical protein
LQANQLRGYRSILRLLASQYNTIVRRYDGSFNFVKFIFRDTVMRLLRELDPEGVIQRKGRRLKRRSYSHIVFI